MSRLRFGVIGYGAWGAHHARVIAECPEAQLVAVAVPSEGSRARASAAHPGVRTYADYDQMLRDESLDVVTVVLPTNLHYEAARAVLESGRHLLLEKPMAPRLDQCDDLIRLAAARGRMLAVGHEFRLSSLWGRVKELIDAGAIGEPRYALIELWRNPYRLGAGGWRYDIKRVGNWILEEPIHFFDLARWYLAGLGEPTTVNAAASARRPDHPELCDNFTATLQFPRGAYAVVSQTLAGWEHHQVAKVTGTEGALWANWSGALDRTFEPTFWLKHHDGKQLRDVPVERMTGEVYELADQMRRVVRSVRDGTPPAASGADGRWSVAMCLKAQESVDRGAPVGL